MTLSELVTHTAQWMGVSRSLVESHARYLRENGLLTSGGRGLAAPEMTTDDKLRVLVSVCGCGTARTAPKQIQSWLSLPAHAVPQLPEETFSFFIQPNLCSALFALFDDIRVGKFKSWKIAHIPSPSRTIKFDKVFVTVNFDVDDNYAIIRISRTTPWDAPKGELTEVHQIEFGARRNDSDSRLIREVGYSALEGWATCLR